MGSSRTIDVGYTCPFCGEDGILTVPEQEWEEWREGTLIQNAFTTLTSQEREYLITGTCEKCWEDLGDG